MVGPHGEKRPGDVIANAVHVAKLATGEIEEEYVDQRMRRGGQNGGKARAATLTPERRREIAMQGVAARQKKNRCRLGRGDAGS